LLVVVTIEGNSKKVNDDKLIELYSLLLDELKSIEIIRTNNLIGDLGESIAINYYNESPILPN